MHVTRLSGRASQAVMLVACLLVCIRLIAGVICSTCILPLELVKSSVAHLHSGGDHEPCGHGRTEAVPLVQWACTVTQDETAFVLPEIPRLPVVVSVFVPLVLVLVSYQSRSLIATHGRGPPVSIS
ncbi:hypothetical protein [Nitrospira lenta]|uniref:Uncharacterized protein n=1 Tax=Nitrospira lenta TaxID=1436998 RepID=A0A330L261_9BACT|nr:hypothetical protein [Nitrospira lenta]SPP63724.1 conserved hypothetical protein [Nitrospira lenta]